MKSARVFIAVGLALFVGMAGAHEKPPAIDSNGLHLVKDSDVQVAYLRPGADLSQYDKVILLDAYVAYRKHWARDHEGFDAFRVNKQDAEKIKARVADVFHKEFVKELDKKGFQVVEQSQTGPDVLLVRPAIVNLDVTAPDTLQAGWSASFVASAGQMTLYAELYDSVSSQLIAKVIDPEGDKGFGGMGFRADRVSNKAAEERIVRQWADILAKNLQQTVND